MLALSIIGSGGGYDRLPLQHLGSGGAAVTVNHSETGDISASYRFRTGLDLNYVKPTLYYLSIGIYYNPTASSYTIALAVSMHLPISFANRGPARIG